MSNSMGLASVFVLSSVLLSPLAFAEESPVFAARNQAVAEHAEALFAQQRDVVKDAQQTASKLQADDHIDS
ncbi:hypothetical protein [Pseudomonas cremoricolorata]|uniref:Secreted protein n=1 Tax=Pseudomonas cremoricolorata TaxID=157783 RepID=A0A089WJP0_9PSED|nr:hypothetical protein [Pseudomonas cremoricolorata]AIR89525.1 hypothetical protein LK03_09625 [Pseudomonas cremoricolorata]